jgi:hypothetical protein
MDKLFQLLSDVLSKEDWHSVVRSRELIDQLPSESNFNPYLISRGPEGLLEINKKEDYDDGVSDPSLISTSESCLRYIFQLMGYIHECEMRIDEFIFGVENRWSRRNIEPGILFEYFLLLVQRYFEMIAEEEDEDDVPSLFNLSDDDGEEFEEMKKIAQVLLSLLNLASTDFRTNPHILPKIHALIDSFMRQFPDAMYLVVLADFSERGFEELYIDEERENTGMCSLMNHGSFRDERIFQTLCAFKNFPLSSYFTHARFFSTFACLLKKYCEPIYSSAEFHTAILNVTAFLIQKLSYEDAIVVLENLFTELEKQREMVLFIMDAILVVETSNIRGFIQSPKFPIDSDESQRSLHIYFGSCLSKYELFVVMIRKRCSMDKLTKVLSVISKKSLVVVLVLSRLFHDLVCVRKLDDIFVYLFDDLFIKSAHLCDLSNLLGKDGKNLSDMLVSTALQHLERMMHSTTEKKQYEYRNHGVSTAIWETRLYEHNDERRVSFDDLESVFKRFPIYAYHYRMLEKIKKTIPFLQKYNNKLSIGSIQDSIEIKQVDATKVKNLILDRLCGGQ